MSNGKPSSWHDIAEHSMCQPGRPSPNIEGHLGSPGFAAFHSTKSSGSFFASATATRSPARRSSRLRRESLPYSGKLRTL
jgi:hypothetical protein